MTIAICAMCPTSRVIDRPFKLREKVYRTDRYLAMCICPGADRKPRPRRSCKACKGPFTVTAVKECWPMAQTGWLVSVKDPKTGRRYVGWDSSWFERRRSETR